MSMLFSNCHPRVPQVYYKCYRLLRLVMDTNVPHNTEQMMISQTSVNSWQMTSEPNLFAAESGKLLLQELWHTASKQLEAVLSSVCLPVQNFFSSPLRFYVDLVNHMGTNLLHEEATCLVLATWLV